MTTFAPNTAQYVNTIRAILPLYPHGMKSREVGQKLGISTVQALGFLKKAEQSGMVRCLRENEEQRSKKLLTWQRIPTKEK